MTPAPHSITCSTSPARPVGPGQKRPWRSVAPSLRSSTKCSPPVKRWTEHEDEAGVLSGHADVVDRELAQTALAR